MHQTQQALQEWRRYKQQETLMEELLEYQVVKQKIAGIEARLEEFCCAIEDFDLACASEAQLQENKQIIYCCQENYTPQQLLVAARQAADQLEATASEMVHARMRVLTKILKKTDNVGQYHAIRYACVDFLECEAMHWAAKHQLFA